jgi:formyltetrahydrofolate deformylase|tara:strand:+ start:1800 stop:2684 length:885 start_codon:yes stop_codon:yes gene_type:complete
MNKTQSKKSHFRSAILLSHCPDAQGIVASVTEFLYRNKGNILYLDQHVDDETKVFFIRIEWDLESFQIVAEKIEEEFQSSVGDRFGMTWALHFSDEVPRMALFVSKLPHCLYDILSQWKSGEWNVELPLIISNHSELEHVAERFEVDFHFFNITKESKAEEEKKQLELLKEKKIDFIVLARYMQILTEDFISEYPNRIINIHHSFLPAFPGARPYQSAYQRGVKIIGATSHFVTAELDAGPIIEQDVVRVSHVDSVKDLVRKGRDLEKVVLSRAIWHHLQRKILVYNNRTVIFS